MNIEHIIIALLVVALVVAVYYLLRHFEDLAAEARRRTRAEERAAHESERADQQEKLVDKWLDRCADLEAKLEAADAEVARLIALQGKRAGPARFAIEGLMPEAEIARSLGGMRSSGTVVAMRAHVSLRMATLLDMASSPPGPNYTAEHRLHDGGGAVALASLLRDLDELTANREESESPAKAA